MEYTTELHEENSLSIHLDTTSSIDQSIDHSIDQSINSDDKNTSNGTNSIDKTLQVPKIISVESRLSEEDLHNNCCLNCICCMLGTIFWCWVKVRT